MKLPLSWLREYVEITLPLPQLIERLALAGLETAGVRVYGLPVPDGIRVKPEEAGPVWHKDKIVTAKVLGVEKHPNADKLKLVQLEYGAGEPKMVVTGATNINVGDVGQKVILALVGSVLFDGHSSPKKLMELKPTTLRGVPSDSMVCSALELGIADEHEGIIILPDDAPVGVPLADYMGDVVLDIDVLPNMARCLAMLGVAREIAAITGQTVKPPDLAFPTAGKIDGLVDVKIADPKLSARYSAMLIRDITIGPAPGWMQNRLTYAGMRPINNVVDISNYVMLEWGQPLHAFDYDVLRARAKGKTPIITVRPAKAGEVLVTLDKAERKLTSDMLLIADDAGPIALAGVMGGLETEVSEKTKNILLESANFDFVSIRRTMRALDLPSEASLRFSKGIHPEQVKPAALRASQLLHRHAGGSVCAGMVDCYPAPRPPQVIELKLSEVRRVLGIDVTAEEAERTLKALDFTAAKVNGGLRTTAPPNRIDIQEGPADLIEELARIHGYDRLPATLLADPLPQQLGNRPLQLEEYVRDRLVTAGLQEVITYSLTTPEREAPLQLPAAEYVRIVNPISVERVVMRHSLLAGVLEITAANLRHGDTVRVYEVGYVYLPLAGERLPDERLRLAIVLTGRRSLPVWTESGAAPDLDFFDLKGIVEGLMDDLHLTDVACRQTTVPHLHPGQAAEVTLAGQAVGAFGQLHPKIAQTYELGNRPVFVGELDLQPLLNAVPDRFPYQSVPRFPAALRDIAVIIPDDTPADRVVAEIRSGGGELLAGARLFDQYRGSSIPAGTKSLAYALSYQAADRTLTDKEVDKAHKKIEDRLKHVLKAQIRGLEG